MKKVFLIFALLIPTLGLAQQYSNSSRLKPDTGAAGDAGKVRYSGHYRGLYLEMAKTAAPDLHRTAARTERGHPSMGGAMKRK